MEIKLPRNGSVNSNVSNNEDNKKHQPVSRLKKQAPSSLMLDTKGKNIIPCDDSEDEANNERNAAPIPLLSPLVLSPAPLWEVKDESFSTKEHEEGDIGGETSSPHSPGEGWHHPALLETAVLEPASLTPLFEFQCSMHGI